MTSPSQDPVARRNELLLQVADIVQTIGDDPLLEAIGVLREGGDPEAAELAKTISATLMVRYAVDEEKWRPAIQAWVEVLRHTHQVKVAGADA